MTREPPWLVPNPLGMVRVSRTFRSVIFAATVTVGLAVLGCVATSPGDCGTGSRTAGSEPDLDGVGAELVDAHNRVRAARHLAPLTVNGSLGAAARVHARDMARRRWMSHRGGDLSSPFQRIVAQGYAFRRAGENVAAGYSTVDGVMNGWMRSPGHRRNILGRFSEIGAACAIASDGTTYWCVTFGDPEAL